MRERSGLSYVEVVIVAFVLVVAGTKAVPKFTEASEESRTGDMIYGLQEMRNQLAMYRVQHESENPPFDSFESFKRAMTTKIGQFGPYLKRIPVNPHNGLDTVRFDGEPAGANSAGWRLDTQTGSFQADNHVAYAAL